MVSLRIFFSSSLNLLILAAYMSGFSAELTVVNVEAQTRMISIERSINIQNYNQTFVDFVEQELWYHAIIIN